MQETKELTTQEKARLMQNAYRREWARKNPDKIRAYKERYYSRKYDEMIEQMIEDFRQDQDLKGASDDLLETVAHDYIRYGVNLDDERGETNG